MSAGERHVVGSALFELEVPEGGPAVADYVRGRLLPLAEAIFDEFDEPGRVIRIERLELDLGEGSPGGDWPEELERRFGEALRQELRTRPSGISVPSTVADLDVLAHVLRTGTLPWAGGWGEEGSLDAFAGRVILSEPRGFARWLGRLGEGGPELRRLVRQTSDETLALALAALSGRRAAEWKGMLGRLDGALRGGAGASSEREARRGALVEALLRRLGRGGSAPAGARTGSPSRESGASGLLALLDAALPSRPADVAGAWERALVGEASIGGAAAPALPEEPRAGKGEVPETGAGEDVGEAGDPSGEARRHREGGDGGTGGPDAESIGRRLEEALRSGALAAVLPDLSLWLRSHPEVVAAVVRQAATRLRVRRMLAEALPDAAYLELVELLAPGAREEVARVLDDPTGLGGGAGAGARAPGRAPDSLRSLLREFTLAHLVVDDPRGFLSGRYREALRLRMAGEGRAGGQAGDPGAAPELPSPYAALRRLLLSEGVHDDSADADLEAVLQGPPDNLLRLLETLRADGGAVRVQGPGAEWASALDRVAGWPAARVWRLTEGLLAAVARGAPDGGRELRRAVRKAGRRLADPRRLHVGVIQALVEGGWIDLDRLREDHPPPVAPESGRPPRVPGRGGLVDAGDAGDSGGPQGREGIRAAGSPPAAAEPPVAAVGTSPAGRPVPGGPESPRAGGASGEIVGPRREGRAGGNVPEALLLSVQRLLQFLVESGKEEAREEVAPGTAGAVGPPSAGGATPPSGEEPPSAQRAFRGAVDRALATDPAGLRRLLEEALEEGAAVEAVVRALPGPTLARVLLLLRPGAGDLLRAMDAVGGAVSSVGTPFAVAEREKWRFLFLHLVTLGGIPEPGRMATALVGRILRAGGSPSDVAPGRPAPPAQASPVEGPLPEGPARGRILEAVRVRLASGILAAPEVGARVLDALSQPPGSLDADGDGLSLEPGPRPPRRAAVAADRDAPRPEPGKSVGRGDPPWSETDTMFVANAGIVLAAPYLPSLFDRLGLLAGGGFRSGEHAARAVHIIQYLVEGRVDRPEHLLPLNKLLCGLGEDDVLPAAIELAPGEEEVLQGLLSAILQHWGALGNTTVQGLQESFFQREGVLRREGDAWRLQVEARPFDMLIDRIPWSFGLIRFGWMDRVLHVDWRG